MKLFRFRKKTEQAPRVVYVDSLTVGKTNNVFPFILQLLLLYTALVGFVCCVATSVNMTVSPVEIALICLPMITVSCLFTLGKKLFITFLSVFGAAVLFVVTFMRNVTDFIVESFTFCYNVTIKIVVDEGYQNYLSSMTEDITGKLADTELMSRYFYCVVIVLAIVFSVIFAATMMKRSLVLVGIVPCFIVLTPSLYYGAVPDGIAFCIFISGIIGVYIQSISYSVYRAGKKKSPVSVKNRIGHSLNSAVNGFFTMCIVLAFSIGVSAVVYSSEVLQIDSVREIIENAANKILNKVAYSQFETADGAIGGLLHGDILELKTPSFRDLQVMTVTTETNSSLYLRGWIGKELKDDGWKILNDDDTAVLARNVPGFNQYTQFMEYTKLMSPSVFKDGEIPENTNTEGLGFVSDTITVKAYFSKSLMMFIPINGMDTQVTAKHRGITTIGDTIYFFIDKRPTGNKYTINSAVQSFASRDFYSNFRAQQQGYLFMAKAAINKRDPNEQEQFMQDERKYREYVESEYMTVPEKTEFLSTITDEVTQYYTDNFDKALAIERYFKTGYKYSTKIEYVTDNAVERIRYMINTTKTGYCTYYATAMTVMLRQMGIPARYVIGYHTKIVTDTGARKYTREIKDYNYHAWVEAYFDGIGWLTFDPTPGEAGNFAIRDYDYLDSPSDNPSEEDVPDLPEPPPDIPDDFQGDDSAEMPIPNDSLPGWALALIVIVSVIVLLFGVIACTVLLITHRFNDYYNSLIYLDPTVMTDTVYPHILRLFGSLGYRPKPGEMMGTFAARMDEIFTLSVKFADIIGILEMTQFSDNTVDEDSAKAVNEYFNKLSDSVFYSLNVIKKYYYMATIKKRKF